MRPFLRSRASTGAEYRRCAIPNRPLIARLICRAVGVWEEKAGRNEALFREVNENIAKLEARLPGVSEVIPAICECSRPSCTTQIEIAPDDYAPVRRHPDRFIVALSHEDPSIEHIVEAGRGYLVVEKDGVAADAANAAST
jgi:hypothetical protein